MRRGAGRAAWPRAIASAFAVGAVISACVSIGSYECDADEDCVAASGSGRCEPTRYCSYPDDGCASDRRYSDLAGPYAGLCTEPEPEGSGSSTDAGSTSSGSDDEGSGTATTDEGSTGCPPPCTPGGTERWSLVLAGDSPGGDKLSAVIVHGEGDLIAAGYVQAATRDAWLLRVSPEGEVVTSLAHDVEGNADAANDVALAADGDLWVCGSRRLEGGDEAWLASFPASLRGTPQQAVIAHHVCRTIGVARGDAIVAGGQDYGATGLHAWAHVFEPWNIEGGTTTIEIGDDDTDALRASVRIPGGGYLLGGSSDLTGLVFALEDDALGAVLVQTGPNGGVQGLAAGEDWFVVGGYQDTASSQHDGWVSARDLDGTERWEFLPDDASPINDEVEGVAIAPTGDVFAVGFAGAAAAQRWVCKLDVDGTLSWSVVLPPHAPGAPDSQDIARDVVVLPDGDIVVVGEVTAQDGSLDAWMARLSP